MSESNDKYGYSREAAEMAREFRTDLSGRLQEIISPPDAEQIRFSIKTYDRKDKVSAGISVRIFVAVDKLENPLATTQQIYNVIWGMENKSDSTPPTETHTLIDTITPFYKSNGRIKDVDEGGNITCQKNYIFEPR